MPDYDGRGEKKTTTAEDLLWVPRVVLAPLYFVFELLVRRPLEALTTVIEREKPVRAGEDKHYGLFPTLSYDRGLLPSAGVYLYWDDALARNNHVRAHLWTWGLGVLGATVDDRYELGARTTIGVHGIVTRRRDNLFYGFGPDTTDATKSRYDAVVVDVGPYLRHTFARGATLATGAGVRDVGFAAGSCCDTPQLHERVARGELPAPPRLADGYTTGYEEAELSFDTRERRGVLDPPAGSGLHAALRGRPAFDLSRHPGASWVTYGATATGIWDVTGTRRLLSLSLSTVFVDPIQGGADAIPFTERATLGGSAPMPGFVAGRLADRSAAAATLAYAWPVWAFLDGTVEVATGNVFGAGLRGLDASKLRLSTAFGLRTNRRSDLGVHVLAGFGTDPFDAGASISAFRLALGVTRGF